jgi:predicted enzyme involved in methoxymalonyl-ACP biosynthesis
MTEKTVEQFDAELTAANEQFIEAFQPAYDAFTSKLTAIAAELEKSSIDNNFKVALFKTATDKLSESLDKCVAAFD